MKRAGALGFSQANAKRFPNVLKTQQNLRKESSFKKNKPNKGKKNNKPLKFSTACPSPRTLDIIQIEKQTLEAGFFKSFFSCAISADISASEKEKE